MDDSRPIIDVTPHPKSGFRPPDGLAEFLRRRRGVIILFFLFGLIPAYWWLSSGSRFYEAESRIMIVRTGSGGPVSEAEIASEIELIRDPNHLAKTAAKQLSSPNDALIQEQQRKIAASLSAAPAGKSNLIAVQYRDADPAVAARIVNQIVEFYLSDRRFIFQTGGRPPAEASAQAPDKLAAFDAANHGPRLRAELDARVQRRIDLEGKLAELKVQVRDNQGTAAALRKRLASVPDRIHSRTRTRTSPNAANRQVEETEIVNPLKQQIEADLLKSDSSLAGLKARIEETQTVLREARLAEDRTSDLTVERDTLDRRVSERLDASSRDAGSSNDRPTLRATLLNRAEPPYGPLSRQSWPRIAIAFGADLLLALLLAWLIDQFDKPIYTSGDFEKASGVPPVNDLARGAGA